MFWVIKTQHEGVIGDFPWELEGRFFEIGKKTLIMRSVFLRKNVQHAVDEWWISWGGEGYFGTATVTALHAATDSQRQSVVGVCP